jgi:hypothetical protein
MIKETSPQERQADTFADIKTCLEQVTTPIYSESLHIEDLGCLESTLRDYAELHEIEVPTQIQSYLLELLEFLPRFERCLQGSSAEIYKLANAELKSRLSRLMAALSDEIEDLQLPI